MWDCVLKRNHILIALLASFLLMFAAQAGALKADRQFIHTIQTGSFRDLPEASAAYKSLAARLEYDDRSELRVEQIGGFYSLRTGLFPSRSAASEYLEKYRHVLPQALILKAFYIRERVLLHAVPFPSFFDSVNIKNIISAPVEEKSVPVAEIMKDVRESDASTYDVAGDSFLKDTRLLSAAEAYQLATVEDPDNPELYMKLAEVLRKMNLLDDAVNKMERAVKISPARDSTYRVKLGKLLLRTGDLKRAREQLLAALNYNPGSGDIHYYLAIVAMKDNNYPRAWNAAAIAEALGYDSTALKEILSMFSDRPDPFPPGTGDKALFIKYVAAESEESARNIVQALTREPVFKHLESGDLKSGAKAIPSFTGQIKPSEVHPKIVAAVADQPFFSRPVVVETEQGFHVVQRILPLDFYLDNEE